MSPGSATPIGGALAPIESLDLARRRSTSSGGGWPAHAYVSSPVYGIEADAGDRDHLARSSTCRSMRRMISRGRRVVVGVRAERVALAAHHRRRADAAAADVADAELDDPVRPAHGVVPVAADLDARRRRRGSAPASSTPSSLGQPVRAAGCAAAAIASSCSCANRPRPLEARARPGRRTSPASPIRSTASRVLGGEQRDRPGGLTVRVWNREAVDRVQPPAAEDVALPSGPARVRSARCSGRSGRAVRSSPGSDVLWIRRRPGAARIRPDLLTASACPKATTAAASVKTAASERRSASATSAGVAADRERARQPAPRARALVLGRASRRDRRTTHANVTRISTTPAPIDASSRVSDRRAAANTVDRGRSITVTQPGTVELANATTSWPCRSTPRRVRHDAASGPGLPDLREQGPVGHGPEPREEQMAVAIHDLHVAVAELDRLPALCDCLQEDAADEDAGDPPSVIMGRYGDDDDRLVESLADQPGADVRPTGRDDPPEVEAVGQIGRVARIAARAHYSLRSIQPTPPENWTRRTRVDASEVSGHARALLIDHRGSLRHRVQRRDLAAERRVDDRADRDDARLEVVQRPCSRILVLAPCERDRDRCEQQDGDGRPGDHPPAK